MKPKALVEHIRANQNNNKTLKYLFVQFLGKLSEQELAGMKKSIEKEIANRQQAVVDEKLLSTIIGIIRWRNNHPFLQQKINPCAIGAGDFLYRIILFVNHEVASSKQAVP